jgi:hypothetical protein
MIGCKLQYLAEVEQSKAFIIKIGGQAVSKIETPGIKNPTISGILIRNFRNILD